MTRLEKLEKQLADTKERIREERAARRRKNAQKQGVKKKLRTGRPRIDAAKILEIKIDAYSKALPDVALKHGVSLRTLYNYGITRENLEKELAKS